MISTWASSILRRLLPHLTAHGSGWDRTDPMTIDRPSQIGRLLFGNQVWHGEKDLSANVFAMYDRTYLYIGAAVTDDSVVPHWDFPRMGYPWDTDCMEVVIDARPNAMQGHDPPTPGTYRHLCLPDYRVTDFSAIAWQGAGAPDLPKRNLVPGGETYFHRTRDGYAMIARLPLAGMPDVVAKPGYKIGFDVALNDNDGTSFRKNQHIWAGYDQNQSWWDHGHDRRAHIRSLVIARGCHCELSLRAERSNLVVIARARFACPKQPASPVKILPDEVRKDDVPFVVMKVK